MAEENINKINEQLSKLDVVENDTKKNELSRSERRKIRKQEFKQKQKSVKDKESKKKLVKSIVIVFIVALLVGVISIAVKSITNEKLPSIDNDPYFGPADARVTVIEFGDFQCPYTKSFNTNTLKQVKEKYGDKIKWVYRDMPTGRHAFSVDAALGAECANVQGKFWEYHDLLFEKFSADATSLRSYAKMLALNMNEFDNCIKSKEYLSEINKDYRDGKKAGVRITPTFFVNNIKLQGDLPLHTFEQVIEAEMKR